MKVPIFNYKSIFNILIAATLFAVGVNSFPSLLEGSNWDSVYRGYFFYIYFVTGNLWTCILLHFFIDVRMAFTSNKSKGNSGAELRIE
ncbi:hypothetical protein SAMN05443252_102301 [Bacillus sp. OV322]|nr:hypothetical protein SAMN05443252_102301 [Bacillus sp. OV322]